MRNLKKVLALAVASVMLMGMMVVGTSAASYPDVANDNANIEAIEVLKLVGIMSGDDKGNFNPDKTVTRNEMAVIMVNLLDLKLNGSHPFTDVPTWADKYVAAVYTNGYTSGTTATTYGGDDAITAVQGALMIMKTLGYFEFAGEFGSDWKLATVKRATELDLFKGIEATVDEGLTRAEAAQMVFNALGETVVIAYENGGMSIEGNGITVTEKADYTYRDTTTLEYKLFENDLRDTFTFDAMGRPATQYTYDGETVTITWDNDYAVVSDDDYTGKGINVILQELTGNDDLAANARTTYYLNGEVSTAAGVKAAAYPGLILEIFVDEDNKDVVEYVAAYAYELEKITFVDAEMSTTEEKDGHTYEISFTVANDIYDDDLAGFDAKTYVKDAYVAVVVDTSGDVRDSFIPETTEGKIDTLKVADQYVTIGGTKYVANGTCYGGVLTDDIGDEVAAGDEYKLFLDANGYVIGFKVVTEADAALDNVYYVDNLYDDGGKTVGGGTVTTYYAQLVAMDGTIKEIALENKDKVADNGTRYDENSWNGLLVTISDKKWTDAGSTVHKADNEKYDLAVWAPTTTADLYTDVTLDDGQEIEKADTRLPVSSADKDYALSPAAVTFRVNADTKYLFIEGTQNNLETAVVTGGIDFTVDTTASTGNMFTDNAANYVITGNDTVTAKYVILVCDDKDQVAQYSSDVVFITAESTETGDGFVNQTVYLPDGTKETWKVATGEIGVVTNSFWTYTVNEDGYYELTLADPMVIANNTVWDEEEGVLLNKHIVSADDLYNDLLTVYGTAGGARAIADIDVENAVFVDAHDVDGRGQFDRSINTLARLIALIDNGTVTDAIVHLNVAKTGAVTIVLTSAL